MTEPAGPPAPLTLREIVARNLDDEISYTETGAGRVFAELFGSHVRYALDQDRWYVFDKTHWRPDTERATRTLALTPAVVRAWRDEVGRWDDERTREAALRQVATFESVTRRRATLAAASADPRLQVETEDLDADPLALVCTNGTVNLETGELRPSRAADLSSRCCTVAYHPEAARAGAAPLLDEFFETFVPVPEDRRFVLAVLGYCLRGGNPRRLLPVLWGPSTSGKSQLFAALHKILGAYAAAVGSSVFRGNLDDRPRPDLVAAMFARLAYATESAKNWALHADQVKRLTGGDALPYRDLYRGVVNRVPRFTPLLVTNELPRVTGADDALRRRIISLEFDRSLTPSQEDPRRREAFLADGRTLEALLAHLVAGARDLAAWDEVPERFVLATMRARADMDHTDEFLEWALAEEFVVRLPEDAPASRAVQARELHGLYSWWLRKFGDDVDRRDALALKALNQALRSKGWVSVPSAGTRWVGYGVGEAVPWPVRLGL